MDTKNIIFILAIAIVLCMNCQAQEFDMKDTVKGIEPEAGVIWETSNPMLYYWDGYHEYTVESELVKLLNDYVKYCRTHKIDQRYHRPDTLSCWYRKTNVYAINIYKQDNSEQSKCEESQHWHFRVIEREPSFSDFIKWMNRRKEK
jgi:hypothetical protein